MLTTFGFWGGNLLSTLVWGFTGIALGFWSAFLPVLASGLSSFLGKKSKEKQAKSEWERQQAESEAAARREYEDRYGSPQAEQSRMQADLRLGRLLGSFGGREKAPPSLVRRLDALRQRPEFKYERSPYVKPGGGGWQFAADLLGATGKYSPTPKKPTPELTYL